MWSGILTTFLTILGSLLLMGLPGALLLTLSQPVIQLLLGKNAFRTLPGDNYWPFALALSVLFPLLIVPGYRLCLTLLSQSGPLIQWGTYVLCLYLWAILLTLLLFRHFATLELQIKAVQVDQNLARGQAFCQDILPGASLRVENPANKLSILAICGPSADQNLFTLSPLDANSLQIQDGDVVEVLFSRQFLPQAQTFQK